MSVPLMRATPAIARRVAAYHAEGGDILKKILEIIAANIGAEPIEITAPAATPIFAMPVKKHSCPTRRKNAQINRDFQGKFL